MEPRDICRRLNCSPVTLAKWVEMGCPVERHPPWVNYRVEDVRAWLDENGIRDWPRESDWDLDVPIRSLLGALERKEITPWEAEKVIFLVGSGSWE